MVLAYFINNKLPTVKLNLATICVIIEKIRLVAYLLIIKNLL